MTAKTEPTDQPDDFYELLRCIESRPGMYLLGEPSLQLLEIYLQGYDAACRLHGKPTLELHKSFSEWLKKSKRLKRGGSNLCWSILLELNFDGKAAAWAAFFQWFPEYHREMTGHS
jgi:hypothetical protein